MCERAHIPVNLLLRHMPPLIATILSGYAMRWWSVAVVVAGGYVFKHFLAKRQAAEQRVMTVLITGAGGEGEILQQISDPPLQPPDRFTWHITWFCRAHRLLLNNADSPGPYVWLNPSLPAPARCQASAGAA